MQRKMKDRKMILKIKGTFLFVITLHIALEQEFILIWSFLSSSQLRTLKI